MYRLFREFAHRYDLHTPPGHYKHDHAFVISEALRVAPEKCRLLDVGCGTGVFLETALAAGIDAHGLDVAPEMIEVAARRVGADRVRIKPMQEIDEDGAYDIVCSLSWTIHYAESLADLEDVIARCRRALRPGGLLILQVANEDAMTGAVSVDVEPGPSGEPDDTYFIHRFTPLRDVEHRVIADYVYASRTNRELLVEQHKLRFAAPAYVRDTGARSGFAAISVLKSESISPFIIGVAG
ncbi:MAG TPA: methyltransferase [Thermoanaerobaculia bacterium]|nr:methyltransferase [Thermoanaerobaculia bacterium]